MEGGGHNIHLSLFGNLYYFYFCHRNNKVLLVKLAREPSRKSKITAVPTVYLFGCTIFGGWWIDIASIYICSFRFLSSCQHHYKGVKPIPEGISQDNNPL